MLKKQEVASPYERERDIFLTLKAQLDLELADLQFYITELHFKKNKFMN